MLDNTFTGDQWEGGIASPPPRTLKLEMRGGDQSGMCDVANDVADSQAGRGWENFFFLWSTRIGVTLAVFGGKPKSFFGLENDVGLVFFFFLNFAWIILP